MSPDAAKNLADYNRLYGAYARTYKEGPVGKALQEDKFAGQYKMPASLVPEDLFSRGPQGAQITTAWLKAMENEPHAIGMIESAATNALRKQMAGKEFLTENALEAWRRNHADALRAIDEVSPGFSNRFNSAAKATDAMGMEAKARETALKDFQKSAAGKFLGAEHPDEVLSIVGRILQRPDGAKQFKSLVAQVKDNPDAIAGLRRAGIEWMLQSFGNAKTLQGQRMLSMDSLSKFLDRHSGALTELYGENLGNLRNVAAHLDRAREAASTQAAKVGPGTARDTAQYLKQIAGEHGNISIIGLLTLEAGEKFVQGDIWPGMAAAGGAVGKHIWNKFKAAGISKVNDLVLRGMEDPAEGAAMAKSALDPNGKLRAETWDNLANALMRLPTITQEERQGRAEGGAVNKIDYAAKATQLLRMAEKAKKAHGQATKGLLKYPDSLISGALRLANQDV